VRPPRQLVEHLLGVRRVGRLGVDAAAENDRRVDTEHQTSVSLADDRLGLAARVPAHELGRIGLGRIVLLVARRNDVEGNAQLRQDRPPLRRRRREKQRRRRRRTHRGGALRATQISSLGHCFAHAASTAS
jgi:hypothetical protein